MTFGNPPVSPVPVDEEASYITSDGSIATVRGLEPDRWELISDRFTAEILRDGDVYRTRTHIDRSVITNTVADWESLFTLIFR